MDTIVFTPSALLSLLYQIDELKDKEIGIYESIDGGIRLSIGDSTYEISLDNVTDVDVDEEVVEEVEDVNVSAYEDMMDDQDMDIDINDQPVESGLLKEIAKTLFVGGLVRLGKKMLLS